MSSTEDQQQEPKNEQNDQPAASQEAGESSDRSGRQSDGGRERSSGRQGRQGGQSGQRGPGQQKGGPPQDDSGVEDNVVRIYRCATVVKGGRRFSFAALVVVGDRNGKVGIGYGKAREVPSAVEKARKIATRAMRPIKLRGGTLPHRIVGMSGSARVVLLPASPGTGVIAGASVRSVLELAGVNDCLTKCYGSRNPKNLVRAAYEALCMLHTSEDIEELRGVKIAG